MPVNIGFSDAAQIIGLSQLAELTAGVGPPDH